MKLTNKQIETLRGVILDLYDSGSTEGCDDGLIVCGNGVYLKAIKAFTNLIDGFVSENIIESYSKGVCPDCSKKIPKNVKDGQSCMICGHTFSR